MDGTAYEILRSRSCGEYDLVPCESNEAWLAERAKHIGASEAGAVLGVCPWTSRRKLARLKRGEEAPFGGNEYTERGVASEAHVRALYSIEHGADVFDGAGVVLVSRQWPWMSCTLDGVCVPCDGGDPYTLEIKTVSPRSTRFTPSDASPPPHYVAQVVHQLAVTRWPEARLVARFQPRDGSGAVEREWAFRLSDRMDECRALAMAEKRFWERFVVGGEVPPVMKRKKNRNKKEKEDE